MNKRSIDQRDQEFVLGGEDAMTVSDGSHTMDELYEHRYALFIALCRLISIEREQGEGEWPVAWRSKRHFVDAEGKEEAMYDGWFIMGINQEQGKQMSYHLPLKCWDQTDFAVTLENAPAWDGHTTADVLERLKTL